MISIISSTSMEPFPSLSYILKAHLRKKAMIFE